MEQDKTATNKICDGGKRTGTIDLSLINRALGI
jgi:hypothetical protein